MTSQAFCTHWRQLTARGKFDMFFCLFCIFAWVWAPILRFSAILAGFNERPWYAIGLLEASLLIASFAGFLLAMRGTGNMGNRIIYNYERSWASRKSVSPAEVKPNTP